VQIFEDSIGRIDNTLKTKYYDNDQIDDKLKRLDKRSGDAYCLKSTFEDFETLTLENFQNNNRRLTKDENEI
jgi:hypothetical protein